jgi:hypothetical protein
MKYLGYMICFALLMIGCRNKEKYAPPYFDTNNVNSEQQESLPNGELSSGDIIVVPFIESGGVKYIEVELNRTFSVRMILDSGCSGALISVAEAQHLYSKGVLTDDDFVGRSRSMIADGTVVENMVVNLREVIIGGKIICPNVQATVSSNAQAPLLLGNEVLNRTASYTVDNQNKTINFKLN